MPLDKKWLCTFRSVCLSSCFTMHECKSLCQSFFLFVSPFSFLSVWLWALQCLRLSKTSSPSFVYCPSVILSICFSLSLSLSLCLSFFLSVCLSLCSTMLSFEYIGQISPSCILSSYFFYFLLALSFFPPFLPVYLYVCLSVCMCVLLKKSRLVSFSFSFP